MSKPQQDIRRKRRALEHAAHTGNIRQTCRYFGIPRSLFYVWKAAHERKGEAGLIDKKPCAHSHPKTTPPAIVEQILHLRRTYHLGPVRIVWYLERYHGIPVCDARMYRTLKRHGMNRLPNRVGRRAGHTHRYEKQLPGHPVQVDVKFLTFHGPGGQRVRRYQYTAIEDYDSDVIAVERADPPAAASHGSRRQTDEQPSPLVVLASSHSSVPSVTPFPQS